MKHVLPSVRVWLAVAAIATVAAFLLSYRSIRQSEVSTAAIEHTQQTLSALIALEGTLADLIFASGDEAITRASEVASRRVDDLAVLTLDNERQQLRINRLRGEIEAVARTRRRGPGEGIETRAEAVVPQSLSRTLREIRMEELQLLTHRVEVSDGTSQRLRSTLITLAVGSGVMLVWVFGLVVRDERQRHQVENVLRRANEDLDARVSAA